jgi:hypothetical protein
LEAPEGVTPRVRVSAVLYEPAEATVTSDETEVLLEKTPLRIVF